MIGLNYKITIKEYFDLPKKDKEEIDFIIKNGLKPEKELIIKRWLIPNKVFKPKETEFFSLSWFDIISLKDAIVNNDTTEMLKILFDIEEKDLLKMNVFNVFSVVKWIMNEIKEIARIESINLHTKLTTEEINVGAEDLSEFGYKYSLHILANNDLTKHDAILKMPYGVIFQMLKMNKIDNEIKRRYASRKV